MKKLLLTNLLVLIALCMAAQSNTPSEENPIDCTSYITNPSFEDGFNGWTQSSLQTQTNSDFPEKAGNTYVEKWVSSGNSVGNASVKQTISKLPYGIYKLTVAAMNYSQDNKTKKNTGAYIYADKEKATVYTPDDYSLTFSCISGEAEIGFVANNASGNWIAVDNFRLYLIGDVDKELVVAELNRSIGEAEILQASDMSSTASAELKAAIDAAKLINTESTNEAILTASQNLKTASAHAETAIQEYKDLQANIKTAEGLQESMMAGAAATALKTALDAAKNISSASTDEEVQKASAALSAAIETAQGSIADFEALDAQIKLAEADYDESKEGAAELKAEIDKAKELLKSSEATSEQLAAEVIVLDKALLVFHLANATNGTGIAPKITKTDTYVATGATQALMRATMTGNNLIEKGVCWSTEHEPTVLDNRTTQSYNVNGTIFHITGLKPATVYYLRPYAMNKTYKVAYGDEVKIVTFPKGTATWSWNEGAPTADANDRCRKAMEETIEYFNEWTGIKGFHLSGSYGAQTPTADCSYGGWMRIGPNASYQAIGTVLHETGHGVGVGTSDRWWDTNVHDWEWLGRAANEAYRFLENKEGNSEYVFVGDSQHGWGQNSTYDWLVNGAHKDTHQEIQYIGGMCIMRGLFIDGLCPTWDDENGIAGYTYNFDDTKKYYLMNKNADRGLGKGLLYQRTETAVAWNNNLASETISDSAAWYIEYNPSNGFYMFKNVLTGKYLTHAAGGSSVNLKNTDKPSATEQFQLMPDRKDVTIKQGAKKVTTHGYWFTWYENSNRWENMAMSANAMGKVTGYGTIAQATFDYSDKATAQQWIIISEDELEKYQTIAIASGIEVVQEEVGDKTVMGIYTPDGIQRKTMQKGFNIIKYDDNTSKKIFVK
ncbi:MAG: hypothetical protein J5616_03665 [Bacteroidaceae bacterium]|nr:hypothetical protein [Bacteroidaceae bacterium]